MNINLNTKLQYNGYANTPRLWFGNLIGLIQIDFNSNYVFTKLELEKKLRLGHLVERFVSHELKSDNDIKILGENIQIKKNKITIGELDCLLLKNNKPIHLEIVYKFYLYDENIGNSELEHWIGPNRKDSLIDKIEKLKNKQLPLLYNEQTKSSLKKFKLNYLNIEQKVIFKAQLFVPLNLIDKPLRLINNLCVVGYYISFNKINTLNCEEFYIPNKLDWLVEPNENVLWINYETAINKIKNEIMQNRAVLCWIKYKNSLRKVFIVWW